MSTCPTAALGPPRDPPDTDTWSGSDKSATNQCQLAQRPHQALQEIPQIPTHGVGVTNRPPTNVNLPNGRIRPSNKSTKILDAKEESERKGRLIPHPISNGPLDLDQERPGSGLQQHGHHPAPLQCQGKNHVCFPPCHTRGAHHVGTSAERWTTLAF